MFAINVPIDLSESSPLSDHQGLESAPNKEETK